MKERRPQRLVSRLSDAQFVRFFVASAAGLVVDIAAAYALHSVLRLPLPEAASLSLLIAAACMYFVHEFWTFRSAARAISPVRMAATVISAVVGLFVRLIMLYVSSSLLDFGNRLALLQLGVATGMSFLVNFVLVRRIVGRRPA